MKIRTISDELKETYGQKIYRLSLTSGCTCPNRDGTIGFGGCTFCSEGGSGDFASPLLPSMEEQIRTARERVDAKISSKIKPEDRKYIAYFQSFTNTYARSEEELVGLKELYKEAIQRPEIVILALGTRPDCLDDHVLEMLQEVHKAAPEKKIWIELGLQTCHDRTAERIHRGYPLKVFEDAYQRVNALNQINELNQINQMNAQNQMNQKSEAPAFAVILHTILGLPGESKEDMLETIRYVANLEPKPAGVKLQLLHVLAGTKMAEEFEREAFPVFSMEEYCDLVVECLKILPREITIHRMTGDGPKKLLIEPKWSADKKRVLNMLNKKIAEAQ